MGRVIAISEVFLSNKQKEKNSLQFTEFLTNQDLRVTANIDIHTAAKNKQNIANFRTILRTSEFVIWFLTRIVTQKNKTHLLFLSKNIVYFTIEKKPKCKI